MTAPKRRATAPLPLLLAALAIVAASRPADAGAVSGGGVWIWDYSNDHSSGSAGGALGPTRRSASATEFVGCTVWRGPSWGDGYCEAMTSAGTCRMCWTNDPELIALMSSVGPASGITFGWVGGWDCTSITVANDSTSL